MASGVFVTGPALIYAGVTQGRRPSFFGTCEDTPEVLISHEWEPVYNALGGSRIPSDMAYQGQKALVRLGLTKFTQTVHTRIAATPSVFTGIPGYMPFGSLGTLQLTENEFWPLWIHWPYVTKAVMKAQGLPPGYRFFAARLVDDDAGQQNTKARKISLVLECDRLFNPKNLSWTLYDSDMRGLPGPS